MRADTPRVRGVVFPGAFQPRSDTWLLARAGCRERLAPGTRILELCAGPGFAGITVARSSGTRLTTVDISRRAAINARVNALLNRVAVRAGAAICTAPWKASGSTSSSPTRPTSPGRVRHAAARRARGTPATTAAPCSITWMCVAVGSWLMLRAT
jgi:release factor glutamine methyltransferase